MFLYPPRGTIWLELDTAFTRKGPPIHTPTVPHKDNIFSSKNDIFHFAALVTLWTPTPFRSPAFLDGRKTCNVRASCWGNDLQSFGQRIINGGNVGEGRVKYFRYPKPRHNKLQSILFDFSRCLGFWTSLGLGA